MKAEAVFFDLFDTLLLFEDPEDYHEICLKKMHIFLKRNGVNVSFDDFNRAYFEIRDKFYSESRQSLDEPHFNVRVAQTLQRLGHTLRETDPIAKGATSSFSKEFMRHIQPDEETVFVLKKLHSKYKLGLISNFSIPECGQDLLDKFELRGYFDVVVISGEVNQRKPSPRIFLNALQRINVDPSRALFVGDMVDLDVIGPQRIGMKTALVRRKPRTDISAKPDYEINNLTEIFEILEDC